MKPEALLGSGDAAQLVLPPPCHHLADNALGRHHTIRDGQVVAGADAGEDVVHVTPGRDVLAGQSWQRGQVIVAWDAVQDGRKAPITRPAGRGFADPSYKISLQWLETRK